MSSVVTLITTMNLESVDNLVKKMQIGRRFIIGNQTNEDKIEKYNTGGKQGLVVSTTLRGVGQNRNSIIERAQEDICVLADDDMYFCDNYEEIVKKVYNDNPKADVIIFNFLEESKGRRVNSKNKKINLLNYMNYGAARLTFRRKSILYNSILFNTNFGGGTPHQCGEDSLFIRECLQKGLNVLAVPEALARLTEERESTWFKGYNEKYFFDKGVFLYLAHKKLCYLFAFILLIKNTDLRKSGKILNNLKVINNGIKFAKQKKYL